MGTIAIKLDKVAEIISSTPMEIETVAGDQYLGKLEQPLLPQQVQISSDTSTESVPIDDLVHIIPIGQSFWSWALMAGACWARAVDAHYFKAIVEPYRLMVALTLTWRTVAQVKIPVWRLSPSLSIHCTNIRVCRVTW